jgi:hypothetical protein
LPSLVKRIPSNAQALAVGIKETDHSFGLLKRLNQSVQKNPIKTTVGKFDAILMMFAERAIGHGLYRQPGRAS